MAGREQCCAIIPARGGSKGIPGKNLVELGGKPLLARTIEAARRARSVDEVYLSTDDPEIADVARKWGAAVIERPAEISGDSASSEAALLHALDTIRDRNGGDPGVVTFLQCTAPLTAPEDIDGTVELVLIDGYDSAFAGTEFHYFVWRRGDDREGLGVNHDPAHRPLRQDRELEYLEAGAVYAMRVAGFRSARHRFFGKVGIYVMPLSRCFEVDDPDDLRVAEALLGEDMDLRDALASRPPPRMVVFDFDGVFTDNRVLVLEDGREAVQCNRSDGMGIAQLREKGIDVMVLSTEENPVVTARCEKLQLDCIQSLPDKLAALELEIQRRGVRMEEVVYVGNDRNDVACLRAVGCGIAVSDSHGSAAAAADVIIPRHGGNGAVRLVCDAVEERLGV